MDFGFLDFRLDFWISNWISADGVRDFSRDGPLAPLAPLFVNVLVAHAALAPQVEFELLEGMQQQNTSWTRRQVVCIVFKEIVQL